MTNNLTITFRDDVSEHTETFKFNTYYSDKFTKEIKICLSESHNFSFFDVMYDLQDSYYFESEATFKFSNNKFNFKLIDCIIHDISFDNKYIILLIDSETKYKNL